MSLRILVAEDHPLFRSALINAISQTFTTAETVECQDLAALQHQLQRPEIVDLVLLDLNIPGAWGLSGLLWVREHYPEVPVSVVSAREEPDLIHRALQTGASGFIPKSSSLDVLCQAIKQILDGDIYQPDISGSPVENVSIDLEQRVASLTPQQMKVLKLAAEGLLNKQIAYELGISEATIKAHMTAILKKLGLSSRTQVALALQQLQANN
ncbi:response regulator transcription factor [Pelagibaculum spongiae]|uniref:DNA-binding response regulator n=1 Tax=Pelagibaculum spongiae TaxID=2080658 RepID=A0A2V1GPT4_9GAMM|nr:response regulator transcription factor [Pelagibaculum spongiae]PVZ65413.1 DNA-binding response regulator [Pelagibaculum spongiae]